MKEQQEKYDLPEGWIWTTIDEIGIVVSGGTPSTKNKEFWAGDISWITPADLSDYKEKSIAKGSRNLSQLGLDYSSAKLIPKGSVLFSSRAPIGYVVVAQNDLTTSQGFKNLIPMSQVDSEYTYYYFLTLKPLAEKVASGTTFLELSAKSFSKLPFPLCPLNEQKLIVSQIDLLFSKLDEAEKVLDQALRDLEIYKQTLLKQTFEGKPTELLGKNTKVITKGASPKWQGINYTNDITQVLFITSENVQVNTIELTKPKYVDSLFNKKQKRSILKKGDVLVNIVGASIGRAAVFNLDFDSNINQAVCLIRPKKTINPKYVSYYLNSPIAYQFYKQRAVEVARANLSLKDISEIPFPICTVKEQLIIVNKLDVNCTLVDNLGKTINNVLNEIVALKHSILKKAFEGRLVNYTSEESAESLLNDIQEEKRLYLKNQKELNHSKPKQKKQMEEKKSILEILKDSNSPISAQELWERSTSDGDIERFYSEIKEIYHQIDEVKSTTESLLSLKDENK